jgi:hypothetical protein
MITDNNLQVDVVGKLVTSNDVFGDIWYVPKRKAPIIKITVLNALIVFRKLIKEVGLNTFNKIPDKQRSAVKLKVGGVKKYASRIIKLKGEEQLWYVDAVGCTRVKLNLVELYNMVRRMAKIASPEVINNIARLYEEEESGVFNR